MGGRRRRKRRRRRRRKVGRPLCRRRRTISRRRRGRRRKKREIRRGGRDSKHLHGRWCFCGWVGGWVSPRGWMDDEMFVEQKGRASSHRIHGRRRRRDGCAHTAGAAAATVAVGGCVGTWEEGGWVGGGHLEVRNNQSLSSLHSFINTSMPSSLFFCRYSPVSVDGAMPSLVWVCGRGLACGEVGWVGGCGCGWETGARFS